MMFYDYVIHLYLYALTDNDVTGRLFPLELNEISNSPFHERHLISMFAYLIEFYIVSFCNNCVTSKVCPVYDVAKFASYLVDRQ